jgi:hypothetical protein
MTGRGTSSTQLAAAKVEDIELLSDVENEPQQVTKSPAALLESLRSLDYKIRLSFSHTFHTNLISDTEKAAMLEEIESAIADKEGVASRDAAAAAELLSTGERLLAVMAANEYLAVKGKDSKLNDILIHGERAGWVNMKEEPWRAVVVAKAAKCDYQSAVAALTKTDDLAEAIKAAPSTPNPRKIPAPGPAPQKSKK